VTDPTRPADQQQTVPDDPAALHSDIEQTRERLEETVDEIGRRLDVKSRMRDAARDAGQRVGDVRERANGMGQQISAYGRSHPTTVARAGMVLAVVIGLMLLFRRRRNR
jgi:Protein of unknown function (DUF3618)